MGPCFILGLKSVTCVEMRFSGSVGRACRFSVLVRYFMSFITNYLLQDINFTFQWTTTATQYAISPKAINVSTAASMFKILIHKSPHEICLATTSINSEEKCVKRGTQNNDELASLVSQAYQLFLDNKEGVASVPCVQAFRLVSQLVGVLKFQIEVARKSLLQAAFDAPIHGVLFCIREVMCDLEMRLVTMVYGSLWSNNC